MTLSKSLLLGSAAAIVAVAGAQAADLPSKKAAPATYVKICDAYGAGFFYIPGSDTCVRLGGYVRAEYQYVPGRDAYAVVGNSIASKAAGSTIAAKVAGYNAGNVVAGNHTITAGGVVGTYIGMVTNQSYTTTSGASSPYTLVSGKADTYYGVGYNTTAASTQASVGIVQGADAQSTNGYEIRGRIDVDARTATSMGAARTFIRLRAASTSGVRNTATTNNSVYGEASASSTGISIESAMVQWAGLTFGIAPENYAMMPSQIYNANPWTGFPNGMKQIAYTATLGGGVSATLALEDRQDWGYANGPANGTYTQSLATAANLVANIRLDQSWGFAAVHGAAGYNTLPSTYGSNPNAFTFSNTAVTTANVGSGILGISPGYTSTYAAAVITENKEALGLVTNGTTYGTNSPGSSKFGSYAIGTTVSFKLPMIAAGDQVWFTANYAHGFLGALGSSGGLSVIASASNKRLLGGITRVDQNLMLTSGSGSVDSPYTVGTVNGWNVAAAFTHYWQSNLRSNFNLGYVEINPPTSTATATDILGNTFSLPQWGKGKMWVATGSLVYSPAKDFDIGLELQYANIKNNVQNAGSAVCATLTAGVCTTGAMEFPKNALQSSNITTKLRVERSF